MDEKAFDINNPPRRVTNPGAPETYTHQEFPRHLHRADGTYCEVGSTVEKARALAEGWFLTREDAVKAATIAAVKAAAEAAAVVVDEPVSEPPAARRGRPPKDAVAAA